MFERLLELFLHAKTGVIAGVFLIGTTGALVTATVQNGVTTITITQASASPSASVSPTATATASPTATATASPTASPSSSPSASPSASASPNACSDQAHAAAAAVQTVNGAFSKFHTDLEHLRKDSDKGKDSGKATIENADKLLQGIRQDAIKAIHATNTCASKDDEDKAENDQDKADNDQDEDKNDDNDSQKHGSQQNGLLAFLQGLFGTRLNTTTTSASPSPTPTSSATTGTTFTSTDPQAIADQAVAAMKLVFDDAVAQLAQPTASPQAKNTRPPFTAHPKRTERPDRSGHDGSEGDSERD